MITLPRRVPRRTVSKRLYLPTIVVAVLAAGLGWRGWVVLDQYGPAVSLRAGEFELAGPAVLGFVLLVFLIEQVRPAERRPVFARGHLLDMGYLLVYALLVVPLIVLTGAGFADAVHHSQEELSILTTFRAHPLVHVSFLISAVPVLAIASNATTPAAVFTAYACLGALPHANVRWSYGPAGAVLVSPAYHRIHHAATGRLDINLGTVLTIWDVLSRRAVFPVATRAAALTGLSGRPVPVEQSGSRPRFARTFLSQWTEPFTTSEVSEQ